MTAFLANLTFAQPTFYIRQLHLEIKVRKNLDGKILVLVSWRMVVH